MVRPFGTTPVSSQQTRRSSSTRVSPFQHATSAAALHGLEEAAVFDSSWTQHQWQEARRQRYLDLFEPLSTAASQGGGSSSSRNGTDQYSQVPTNISTSSSLGSPFVAAQIGSGSRISSSGSDGARAAGTQAVLLRTTSHYRAYPVALTTSSSEGSGATATRLTQTSPRPARSRRSVSSSGGGSSSRVRMQQLQRRSSSLLAATSATVNQVWSSITDRSRSLLCISSPAGSEATTSRQPSRSRSSSTSSRADSVDGAAYALAAAPAPAPAPVPGLGPSAAAAASSNVALIGSTGNSSSSHSTTLVVPRLSARVLTRSMSIHRSHARSAAVLIDVDATASYDDLLSLDQFNVKRAVKAAALQALPCRTPSAEDALQQRQCLICFESWLPPPGTDQQQQGHQGQEPRQAEQQQQQQLCCSCGHRGWPGAVPQHVRQEHSSAWNGAAVLGRSGAPPLVPSPAAAELPMSDDNVSDRSSSTSRGVASGAAAAPAPVAVLRHGGSIDGSSSASSVYADAWEGGLTDTGPDVGHAMPALHSPSLPPWLGGSSGDGGGSADSANGSNAAATQADQAVLGHSSTGSSSDVLRGPAEALGPSEFCRLCRCRLQQGQQQQQSAGGVCWQAQPRVLIRKLPCGHEFCCSCIGTWLKANISCPVCRWAFPECDTRLIGCGIVS